MLTLIVTNSLLKSRHQVHWYCYHCNMAEETLLAAMHELSHAKSIHQDQWGRPTYSSGWPKISSIEHRLDHLEQRDDVEAQKKRVDAIELEAKDTRQISWNVLDTWVADDTKTDLYSDWTIILVGADLLRYAREGKCKQSRLRMLGDTMTPPPFNKSKSSSTLKVLTNIVL